jgi:glycosyltransferase involved in cell wall biosynthesis
MALAQVGEEVTIYATDMDFPEGRMNVPVNTPVNKEGFSVWHFSVEFSPYMLSMNMGKALRRHAHEYDLIHIHGLYRFPQAAAAYYARRYDLPYLVTPHGALDPFLYYRRKNRLVKRLYEQLIELGNLNEASGIHFTSQEEMDLTRPLGLKAPGIVVPNGLDLSAYRNLPARGRFREKYNIGNKKIILHLGRLNFKKGLDILVEAFAHIARTREGVSLVLAGPDNEGYGEQVDKWLVREGVRDKAIFTGMLQGQDKLEALKDADIFALPSYSENFGIAVIEAMACRLPVIISDKVNIWQEVKGGGAGLVTSCNAGEVARAIATLLDNEGTRRKIGEAGRVLVSKNYSWDSVVYDLVEAYRAVVRKNKRGV